MRAKLLVGEMMSQCPKCHGVEVLTDVKRKTSRYQQSICDLPSLPKKECYGCSKNHIGEVDDMGVEKAGDKKQ
jgi:hypothetical protein